MIKAIFFDFDGVIVDSEWLHSQVSINFLKSEGIDIPDTEVYKSIGGNRRMPFWPNLYQKYRNIIPYDSFDEFKERLHKYRQSINDYDYSRLLFPHTGETLKQLKERGYLLALASSSNMNYLVNNLHICHLDGLFDYIISGDSLKESKPNPEIYLKCLEHFYLNSDEAIVVEDSPFGIAAAKGAGCKVIAIKDYRFGLDQSQADIYIDGIKEIFDYLDR